LLNEYGNADFIDKIKLTQALHDITTKRSGMISPQGMGRNPIIGALMKHTKVFDPMNQMVMLKKGIQKGVINPSAVTDEIPVSQSLFGGRTISKARAFSHILSPQRPSILEMIQGGK
jgi:hypothetical protein